VVTNPSPLSAATFINTPGYRSEIDGLRAIAVLVVIINHIDSGLLPGGYLGVDIFFVISGYVITLSLLKSKSSSCRSFLAGFYARRIRRLIPSLLVTVVVTCLLTCLVNPEPFNSLLTGAFSLFGVSNIYLAALSTDYFAESAAMNSFTHTWSLGVEEQFYLLYPVILWFALKSKRRVASNQRFLVLVGTLSAVSLLLFWLGNNTHQSIAYFLLPFRFWELSAGCLVCVLSITFASSLRSRLPLPPSLILLALLLVMRVPSAYLSITAPVTVVLTSALILTLKPEQIACQVLSCKPLLAIGVISYPLYLWHWPLLVLVGTSIGLSHLGLPIALAFTFLLAFLTHRFIETPFRYPRAASGNPALLIAFSYSLLGLLAALILLLSQFGSSLSLTHLLHLQPIPPNWGPGLQCHGSGNLPAGVNALSFCLKTATRAPSEKRLYLVGDSHSSQFYFTMRRLLEHSPNMVLAFFNPDDPDDFPHSFWKRHGAAESSPTSRQLIRQARTGDVVVIAFHRGYLNQDRDVHVVPDSSPSPDEIRFRSLAAENFRGLIDQLSAKGVRVVLVRDTPMLRTAKMRLSSCQLQYRLLKADPCEVTQDQDNLTRKAQDDLFTSLQSRSPLVYAWDPRESMMLEGNRFSFYGKNGLIVMRDQNHISKQYAESIVDQFSVFVRGHHVF